MLVVLVGLHLLLLMMVLVLVLEVVLLLLVALRAISLLLVRLNPIRVRRYATDALGNRVAAVVVLIGRCHGGHTNDVASLRVIV